METEEVVEVSKEHISEARDMGWRPKEQFKGDPEKWVDAKTFLEKGEHVLPIVKASRDKLRAELEVTNTKVLTLQQQIREAHASMEEFKKYHEEDAQRRVDAARKELKKQLIQAKKDGNVEDEVEISDAIADLKDVPKAAKKAEQPAPPAIDPGWEPVLKAWMADGNEWFGEDTDKTVFANSWAAHLSVTRKDLQGRDFLDEIAKKVHSVFPDKSQSRRDAPSKVEGSRTGAAKSNGGKSYADLPAEAKAYCDQLEKKVVGPNKAFKTAKEWQAQYAKDAFAED